MRSGRDSEVVLVSKCNKNDPSISMPENETANDISGTKSTETAETEIIKNEEDDVNASAVYNQSPSALESRREFRESERMLFFTDAVTAIAATLLVLPLMDASAHLASEASATGGDDSEVTVDIFFEWNKMGKKLLRYVLGFWIVFYLWTQHIFLYAYVDKITSEWLIAANGLWNLTLVLVPLATTLNNNREGGWCLFFGVIEANFIVVLAMEIIIRRHQESDSSYYSVLLRASSVFWGAVAIVVAATVPHRNGSWAYLPLFAGPAFSSLVLRKCFKKERSPLDEVRAFFARTNFIFLSIGWLLRKCGREKRRDFFHYNEDRHGEIFSRISARLIIFTDATVAISMTLMIINVSNVSQDYSGSVIEFFHENGFLLSAFCISFAIVFYFWRDHEDIYSYQEGRVHPAFFVFTLPWLMTIAFLPVATSLFGSTFIDGDDWGLIYYFVALNLNQVISMVLVFIVFYGGVALPAEKVVHPIMAMLILGLALGLTFPANDLWCGFLIFLLLLIRPLSKLLLLLWPGLPALIRKLRSENNE